MSILNELLAAAVSRGASDLHLKAGLEPYYRVSGTLVGSGYDAPSTADMVTIIKDICPPHAKTLFERDHEADFSHVEDGVGRFRVNAFMAQGVPTLAFRHVKTDIPTFEQLRLPDQLKNLSYIQRGIIAVAGTTGSGKSTTLAALIGEINRTQRRRIITVEDPIEYLFKDVKSVITQREVGLDTLTFGNALKHLMRQDPDVILIGEMRDATSIRTSLLAAETGHLVLTTLHASTSDAVIPRIMDVFPTDEQDQVRMALASNLAAAVCQRLLRDINGKSIPAVEILVNTSTVRKLIERNRLNVISAAVETGREDGMQNFNQAIYQLIREGLIAEEEGMRAASNPESLRMNLKGIFLDEGKRILSAE